jgi:hypothetical protein
MGGFDDALKPLLTVPECLLGMGASGDYGVQVRHLLAQRLVLRP